jgi:hypothetical protein
LKHLIINLDPDDEGNEDEMKTPRASKTIPTTPTNHITNTSQTATTPNHIDSSNVSTESSDYQKQVKLHI